MYLFPCFWIESVFILASKIIDTQIVFIAGSLPSLA